MKQAVLPHFFVAPLALLLVACGGGGGSTNSAPAGPSVTISTVNPSAPMTGQSVSFKAVGSGSSVSYAWAFGDGQTGVGALTSHAYVSAGTYPVVVTITDGNGARAKADTSVTVTVPPLAATIADVSPASPVAGQQISFTGVGGGQPALSYNWDFGEGTSANTATVTHSFATPGTYSVTLMVTDSTGTHVSATQQIVVAAAPVPGAVTAGISTIPANARAGQAISVTGSGSGQGTLSYGWDFGDQSSGSGISPSHTYALAGKYRVSLIVTDSTGKASTPATATITVSDPPAPYGLTISPSQLTPPPNIPDSFTGSAIGSGPLVFAWSFGDGGTGSGATIMHTFASAGTYIVTLSVTDPFGQKTQATDTVTVTAGSALALLAGTKGQAGDVDGTDATALFNMPYGLAVDGGGNIYLSDFGNNTVREISAAGVVTTLAGASAQLSKPTGIAMDSKGNLYVASSGDDTIRKITAGGVVSILAGTVGGAGKTDGMGPAALFNYPIGVAVDSKDNIYVADVFNNTIRKINQTGVVSTFAGSAGQPGNVDANGASARFGAPCGLTVDSNGNLYVTDIAYDTIRMITPAGDVTTLAGKIGSPGSADGIGTAATFNYPEGVAVDTAGNILVTDTGNDTIRKISTSHLVSTIVGIPGSAGYQLGGLPGIISAPFGIVRLPNGNVTIQHLFRQNSTSFP